VTDRPRSLDPGAYAVDLACPLCGGLVETVVELTAVLTAPSHDVPTLKVRCQSGKVPHWCTAPTLFDAALDVAYPPDEAPPPGGEADR